MKRGNKGRRGIRRIAAATGLCLMLMMTGCSNTTEAETSDSTAQESSTGENTSAGEEDAGDSASIAITTDESGREMDADYVPNMLRDEAYATKLPIDEYVTLGKYKGLELDVEPRTATDDEIERWLEINVIAGMAEGSELDDAAVKTFGIEGVETVDELRDYVRETLNEGYAADIDTLRWNAALDMILEDSEIKDPPYEMKERHEELLYRALGQQALRYQEFGVDNDETTLLKETMERDGFTGSIEDYMSGLTLNQCRRELVIAAIADAENITIDEEEFEHELEHMLEDNGYETEEAYTANIGMDAGELLYLDLLREAVAEFVLDAAKDVK